MEREGRRGREEGGGRERRGREGRKERIGKEGGVHALVPDLGHKKLLVSVKIIPPPPPLFPNSASTPAPSALK